MGLATLWDLLLGVSKKIEVAEGQKMHAEIGA